MTTATSTSTEPDPKYKKYNDTEKGRARRERYEAKHPERKARWSALMTAKAYDRNGNI